MMELPIPPRKEREANPKFVELLKGAKSHLWDGTPADGSKQVHICFAVAAFAWWESTPPAILDKLECDITESLGGAWPATDEDGLTSYTRWASIRLGYKVSQIDNAEIRIQAARLRWVNQLIEEYGGTI